MADLQTLLRLTFSALSLQFGSINEVPVPPIDLNEWWGPGTPPAVQNTSITKFTIKFDASMISDLRSRLKTHEPFTPPLEGVAFNYGFNSTTLEEWAKYLAEKYPFKKREVFLNQYPHYTTVIQGLKIHFMRIKTDPKNTTLVRTPLLLLHGWPGSFREFYESVPYLLSFGKAKGIALDIIVPSLPGFGFSEGSVRPGLGLDKAAVIFRNLMQRLGYSKYIIQGGDLGASVGANMATFFPKEVWGYHTNLPAVHTLSIIFKLILGSFHPESITTPDLVDRIYPLKKTFFDMMIGSGFFHIQATKPDTVGIGLADSPAGLMAYTLEKLTTGVRKKFINYPDGGLTKVFSADQILDNYMIYWSSRCMTTAMRIYADTFNLRYFGLKLNEIKSQVPTWVSQAPDEVIYLPVWLIKEKFPNVLNETLPAEGGHFYAWEQPKPFAEDVVNAIEGFNNWHEKKNEPSFHLPFFG